MAKDEDKNVSDLLKDARNIISKHEDFHRKTGSLFNIFKALNIQRKEVICHEAFIHDIINLQGSHGQGDKYLKLFLEKVLSWDLSSFGIESIKVEKEFSIHDNKRLDLRIESSKSLVIIEMKIDQEDSEGQLDAYIAELNKSPKKDLNKKLFYLTLLGTKPVYCKDFKSEDCISFKKEILNWVDACIKESIFLPGIREVLQQYANIVRELTNQLDGDLKMDIVNLLSKNNNLEVFQEIKGAYDSICSDEKKFWNALSKELHKISEGTDIELSSSDGALYSDKSNPRVLIEDNLGFYYQVYQKRGVKKKKYIIIGANFISGLYYGFNYVDDSKYYNVLETLGFTSDFQENFCEGLHKRDSLFRIKSLSNSEISFLNIIYDKDSPAKIANQIFNDVKEIYDTLRES